MNAASVLLEIELVCAFGQATAAAAAASAIRLSLPQRLRCASTQTHLAPFASCFRARDAARCRSNAGDGANFITHAFLHPSQRLRLRRPLKSRSGRFCSPKPAHRAVSLGGAGAAATQSFRVATFGKQNKGHAYPHALVCGVARLNVNANRPRC